MTQDTGTYDLLLKGGHVIDPKNRVDGPMDVAIEGGKIAQVAPDVPSSQAKKAVSVSGLYVTPGLIDIHTHVYGATEALFPDGYALPSGTTTVVDAGSVGWRDFEALKDEVIDRSITRVLAFLNIAGGGMVGDKSAEQDVEDMDPAVTAKMIAKHPDLLVGVKSAHFGGSEGSEWESADRAVEAGERSGTPVMIDFAPRPARSYRDLLLEHLRPGDIHTHMYAQHIPFLDENGAVNEYIREARDRGVIFDLGHGAGSFWFRIAIPALRQEFGPDSISTDIHKHSILIPQATMTPTMSKLLNIGMPVDEVILRSTVTPAAEIGRPELGTLSVGSDADIAVLDLMGGDFGFVDSGHAKMRGDRRLQCVLTVRCGKIVWDLNGLSWPDWRTAGDYKVIR